MLIPLISLVAALSMTQQPTGGAAQPAPARSAAAVTTATPGSAPNTTLGEAPAAPTERVVCTNTQVTGSRFPIRRCRTVGQANGERQEAVDQLRQAQINRLPSS